MFLENGVLVEETNQRLELIVVMRVETFNLFEEVDHRLQISVGLIKISSIL